jgi:hypothetical protein
MEWMCESIVDVARQDRVNMRRRTARQSVAASAGIHRDAGVPRLAQGMMADQDAPGVISSSSQLLQCCIQAIEIDDAIGPVQPALDATRRVDRRDTNEAVAELDKTADTVKPVHVSPVEFEWRGKAPVQVKRQVKSWSVVIARSDDAGDPETFEPGAGCPEFALPAILRDVAGNQDRIGANLRDVFPDRIERCRICSAKVNIRNVDKLHGVRRRRFLRHWRLLMIPSSVLKSLFHLQDSAAIRYD